VSSPGSKPFYLFLYLVKSYRSLIAVILPVIFICFFSVYRVVFTQNLKGTDVPLRNYFFTNSPGLRDECRTAPDSYWPLDPADRLEP